MLASNTVFNIRWEFRVARRIPDYEVISALLSQHPSFSSPRRDDTAKVAIGSNSFSWTTSPPLVRPPDLHGRLNLCSPEIAPPKTVGNLNGFC